MLAALALLQVTETPQAVFDRVCAKLNAATSLRTDLIMNPDKDSVLFEIYLDRSGRYSIRAPKQGFVSDGTTAWMWFDGSKAYYRSAVGKTAEVPSLLVGLNGFYRSPDSNFQAKSMDQTVFEHRDVRRLKLVRPGVPDLYWNLMLGADDLPVGYEQCAESMSSPLLRGSYARMKLGVEVPGNLLAWSPPADYEEKKTGAAPSALAAGVAAPTIVGTYINGKPIDLSQIIPKTKVTLLNFWFIGCAPCRQEMPHLQKLHATFESKGLRVITVNQGDHADAIAKYFKDASLTMPVIGGTTGMDAIENYKVSGFPTTYLIGQDGKIKQTIIGMDLKKLDAALAKEGYSLTAPAAKPPAVKSPVKKPSGKGKKPPL